ncbi:MAG TPA: MBL fold metallo-hydrolase [Chitinophagaceae bacterium]|nr:MBL fold metallo-hydrolase [Chitinophagaceae bacterium]
MNRFLPLLVLCCVFMGAFGQRKRSKASTTNENFTIQQLAPGVWAAIQNDQFGRAICNAGIVDLGDKTLVYDPFMTPGAARDLRTLAFELTGRPVSIVVNSHYHNDHIRGNQEFMPIASIVSTAWTRDKIATSEPEEQAWEKKHAPALLKAAKKMYAMGSGADREELPMWIGYYEGIMESMDELKIILPDIVFNDSLWLMGTARSVKLEEFKNGHTGSDIVLYLPAEQIAFMGDLLFVKRHPWINDGDPANWQLILKKWYENPSVTTFVPGHGPVCDKQGVKELLGYLSKMQDIATTANTDSLQSRLLMQPIPSPYDQWSFNRFYEPNMKFLFARNRSTTAAIKNPE